MLREIIERLTIGTMLAMIGALVVILIMAAARAQPVNCTSIKSGNVTWTYCY
jgi:hypothetical protein